jgi:peptidyl-prolyl cis-trans isomerase C
MVARVGSELIASSSVGRVAASQNVAPKAALAATVSDALFASEARGSTALGVATSIERAASARSLLEQLAREASRAGPPSDSELSEIARERWVELDRPDAVRTTHAVVRNQDPKKVAAARQIADRLAAAVKTATSSEEFTRIAQEVPHEGFELKAEALSPVTPDGRTFERRDSTFVPRGTFDADFARAANQLTSPGQISPVIQSRFGLHVIRLDERVPGVAIPKTELATLLQAEVLSRRAGRARRELLEKLRQGVAIQVDRAHDELTAKTKSGP